MGWFWADNADERPGAGTNAGSACPHTGAAKGDDTAGQRAAGQCPRADRPAAEAINRLNMMPVSISQERASGQAGAALPRSRDTSSIPRGDGAGNWQYPSAQQMFNAMWRKGHRDTPEDAVESMVAVHNFLNEGAWAEIVDWERRYQGGAGGSDVVVEPPRLLRFMGRPDARTPKARMLLLLGWLAPARFGAQPPFDRHDWFVQRRLPDGRAAEVRYVIDYYAGPPERTGAPVFYLDVRPAVDSPSAALLRLARWGGDVWARASGAPAREARQ